MAYKTTKKDFADFKKECEYWIEYFGLKDWFLFFDHIPNDNNFATLTFNTATKNCGFHFNTDLKKKEGLCGIKKTAFHEVCELLLAPVTDILLENVSSDKSDSVTHGIIARLENTLWKEHQ